MYFICLLILLAFSGHAGLTQNARDLTRYDEAGVFDFSWGVSWREHAQMKLKLRDFLWEHWTQKRLAHMVVTVHSIEGDPTTYNLFVEPDKNKRWLVVGEYESLCCWFYSMEKPKRKPKRVKGVVTYDVVERVQTSSNDQATLPFTPGVDRREADSYILRLRRSVDGDKLGRELIF